MESNSKKENGNVSPTENVVIGNSPQYLEFARTIYQQNWEHIRHIETQRFVFLPAFLTFFAALLTIISNQAFQLEIVTKDILLIFLVLYSCISLVLAIKSEAVVDDYMNRNKKIVEKFGLQDLAGHRVKSGIWKIVRFQYFVPIFYLFGVIASVGATIFLW